MSDPELVASGWMETSLAHDTALCIIPPGNPMTLAGNPMTLVGPGKPMNPAGNPMTPAGPGKLITPAGNPMTPAGLCHATLMLRLSQRPVPPGNPQTRLRALVLYSHRHLMRKQPLAFASHRSRWERS